MNKLKISTRLALLIGALSALLLGIGALGIFGINRSNDSLKTVYEDRVVALDQLGEVSYLLQRNRVLVMDMLVQPAPANLEKRNRELRSNLAKAGKTWDAYMATYLTPDEAKLAQEFVKTEKPYGQEGLIAAASALVSGQTEVAQGIYKDKISPLAPAPQEVLKKLNQLQLDVAKQEFETAVGWFHTALTASLLCIAAGLLFALAFGYALARGIGRQLGGEPGDAARVAASVAKGDLSMPIPIRPGDTSSLMVQLKSMQTSLAGVVTTVRQGSEAVAAASAQIAQGNHDLSARTEQQASALQQTAASMEELSAAVQQTADSSRQADLLATSASRVAQTGGEVVAQVVDTMKGINEASRKISDIIGVIDGIAFQTNILALNAAVEAARAGEQGRGFAVVASEVRTLAGRSADAAREIKTLINASVERVEQGTALVAQAGSTMAEVVSSIRRVTDMMCGISAASSEQSMGVAQIGEAVNQLDQTTQQNAALVEEMAAAAGSLNLQARELVGTVAVFKLDAASHTITTRPLATRSTRPAANAAVTPNRRLTAAQASTALAATPARWSRLKAKEVATAGIGQAASWEMF